MLKYILFSLFVSVSLNAFVFSQECTFYFPTQPETVLEYGQFDAKGRMNSVIRKKVIKSEKTADGYLVVAHKEVFDNQDSLVFEDNVEMKCFGGEFFVDMSCYYHHLQLDQYAGKEILIESDTLTIPNDPKPGMLPSFVTSRVSILEDGIPVKNMVVNVYFRIVQGYEDVITPAGTFNCLKISYEVETIVNQKVKSKGVEWFSKEAGLVKRETFELNGKLIEKIELRSLTKLN
jgi:hypothetical protein